MPYARAQKLRVKTNGLMRDCGPCGYNPAGSQGERKGTIASAFEPLPARAAAQHPRTEKLSRVKKAAAAFSFRASLHPECAGRPSHCPAASRFPRARPTSGCAAFFWLRFRSEPRGERSRCRRGDLQIGMRRPVGKVSRFLCAVKRGLGRRQNDCGVW